MLKQQLTYDITDNETITKIITDITDDIIDGEITTDITDDETITDNPLHSTFYTKSFHMAQKALCYEIHPPALLIHGHTDTQKLKIKVYVQRLSKFI